MDKLPQLVYKDLLPTRNYLQNICLAIGEVQRAFLPKNEHDWQYGLEVGMRGISTQEFTAGDQDLRISIDLVTHKVRLGDTNWKLDTFAAPQLLEKISVWFEDQAMKQEFTKPAWIEGESSFNQEQSDRYGKALWWLDRQFASLKAVRLEGLTSPLLLYPHHFDLALAWFPYNNEKQLSLGFSTGDETVTEPYIYGSAYPEPGDFHDQALPEGGYWSTEGFSGAVLPYAVLQASADPAALLKNFADKVFDHGKYLLR